jgi:tetratricopeptide (TPR) repeat protein
MFTQWLAADPKLEERITALHQRAMTHILKEDYDKAVADLTEAMRLVEKLDKKDDEKACWAGFLYLFRGLAYASQGNTLDKAMDDLTKIQFVPHEHEDFPEGYWAPLFRTAIRLRHLDFSSVGQVKAKTGREAKRSVIDILGGMGQDKTEAQSELLNTFVDLQGALGNREGPEAYAMMIYFLDKLGDHEMAAKHREAAKRETSHGTAPDIIAMVIDDAFQKCFARLAPEIEKRAVVIREARARNNESPY